MGVKRLLLFLLPVLALWGASARVQASSGVQIDYSPAGSAFTTNRGETSTVWYREGTTVRIQDGGAPPVPETGQHLYHWKRTGEIPIAYWRVAHSHGRCIHNVYSAGFHGVSFNRKKCEREYYSGWVPYCRDCGERAADFLFYMSGDTAGGIHELQTGMGYYYLCPWCDNLEQAREITPHICQAVSANRYVIVYDSNGGGGYMVPSTHMYNDTALYEGREVTPQTTLSLCGFWRVGYRFDSWNTRPDGTGQRFEDGERIYNLSDKEGDQVVLYAQWTRVESVLYIDPAGGSYCGNAGVTALPGDYGSTCLLEEDQLIPPQGYLVSFDARGGEPVDNIVGTKRFREWSMTLPFHGQVEDSTYHYLGEDGTEDRLTALYTDQSIVLPDAYREGQSFGGWYYDPECTRPAGAAGDDFTPSKDTNLYATWGALPLKARAKYIANKGKGAV
ncbi:MAG: InlB B-repeat-containing protein, partial [Acetatifactor sp.]|nr:InlB B-repeat-containing protein [Acetatifactor sp.]